MYRQMSYFKQVEQEYKDTNNFFQGKTSHDFPRLVILLTVFSLIAYFVYYAIAISPNKYVRTSTSLALVYGLFLGFVFTLMPVYELAAQVIWLLGSVVFVFFLYATNNANLFS